MRKVILRRELIHPFSPASAHFFPAGLLTNPSFLSLPNKTLKVGFVVSRGLFTHPVNNRVVLNVVPSCPKVPTIVPDTILNYNNSQGVESIELHIHD